MKALVLSGGTGSRLRPITHTSAKQLVPVANKPVLFYGIEAIRDAGIKEIGIIVGGTKEEIKAAVGDGSQWGVKVTYIEQEAPLGLAHTVVIAREFLGDEPFVMYLGDNLVKSGITNLVRAFEAEKPNASILLSRVKDPQRFGVAELKDGRVVNLVEKPKVPRSDLALVGVYMFDRNIHEAVRAIKPSWRGELEITDAIQYLVDKGYEVKPHIVDGWWKDTGKVEDMLEANRIMLEDIQPAMAGEVDETSSIEGRVVVEEGTEIINSVLRGPIVVGRGCKIIDSYIGPFTAIYHGVEIRGSEVEHSIILENSKILEIGSRIENSLIGRNVRVHHTERRPKSYQLVLGDNSEVGIQ
ncbi:MAG: glucose-1-phosphate thymidylyltransferase [Syntrophothermus sp.]